MGYCMTLLEGHLRIKDYNKKEILEQLQEFASENERISFVDKEEVVKSEIFLDALFAMRYELTCADKNTEEEVDISVYDVEFIGEKLGDEDSFMIDLLSLCESGSILKFEGEDGLIFAYENEDGQGVENDYGTIVKMSEYKFNNLLSGYKVAIKTRDNDEIFRIEEILKKGLC